MSQHSLTWPLSVALVALLFIGMILINPASPSAAPSRQDIPCDAANEKYYPACATETAAARQTETNQNQNDDDNDNDNGGGGGGDSGGSSNNQSSATSTPTSTRTRTPTPTEEFVENEDEDEEPTETPETTREQPTTTPTSTVPPDSDVLACVPDVAVWVEGITTPKTALLLYFDGRAVGGATSNVQGFYRIQLLVGDEKPGDYPVEVQVRGTRDVVDELICRVPGASDTPTPTATEAGL